MKIRLGEKAGLYKRIDISLPSTVIELKSYCKVHSFLNISEAEFDYTKKHGLGKLVYFKAVKVDAVPVSSDSKLNDSSKLEEVKPVAKVQKVDIQENDSADNESKEYSEIEIKEDSAKQKAGKRTKKGKSAK